MFGSKVIVFLLPVLTGCGITYANKEKLGLNTKNTQFKDEIKKEVVPVTVSSVDASSNGARNIKELIVEIKKDTEIIMKRPVEAKIRVNENSQDKDKYILFYYSNEAKRVNNSASWTETERKFKGTDEKNYELKIYKIDHPGTEKENQGKKVCRFHYKEVETDTSTNSKFDTGDITDCKGWIGLRAFDTSINEKAKNT